MRGLGEVFAGNSRDRSVDAGGGDRGCCGREQVHAPGDVAQWDQALEQFAGKGDKGITGGMGDAQQIGDESILSGVAQHQPARQREQIEQRQEQEEEQQGGNQG